MDNHKTTSMLVQATTVGRIKKVFISVIFIVILYYFQSDFFFKLFGIKSLAENSSRSLMPLPPIPRGSTLGDTSLTVLLEPYITCTHDGTVIIYVLSTIHAFDRRSAIRNSWGDVTKWNDIIQNTWSDVAIVDTSQLHVEIFFVIGVPEHADRLWPVDFNQLEAENSLTNDLLVTDVTDSYENLTNKDIAALQWIKNTCNTDKLSFIFKTDDDVFINMANLLTRMEQTMLSDKECHFLCNCLRNVDVPRDGKWRVSEEEYSGQVFPRYCQGMGYAYCPRGIQLIYRYMPQIQPRPFYLEDVFMTSLVFKPYIGEEGLQNLTYSVIRHHTVLPKLSTLKQTVMHEYVMMHGIPLAAFEDINNAVMTGVGDTEKSISAFELAYNRIHKMKNKLM